MHDMTSIWQEVSTWPPEQRRELATRLLQSLPKEEGPIPVSKERREALLGLIGMCKTDNPPKDEEVDRIVEEGRMRKYG